MTVKELIEKLQEIPKPENVSVYHFDEFCLVKTTRLNLNPEAGDTEEAYYKKPLPVNFVAFE
jgi:hypothetical protein